MWLRASDTVRAITQPVNSDPPRTNLEGRGTHQQRSYKVTRIDPENQGTAMRKPEK